VFFKVGFNVAKPGVELRQSDFNFHSQPAVESFRELSIILLAFILSLRVW